MEREFIETNTFVNNWHELNLTDENLRELQNFMMKNPKVGDIIKKTGGLKKLRWTLQNKGKSGGARVLFIDFVSYGKIILVNCYSKDMKDDLTDKEKAIYKKLIKEIKKEL